MTSLIPLFVMVVKTGFDFAVNQAIVSSAAFPFVELDEFIAMPNHIHGILFFNVPWLCGWTTNKFGPQSKNLASVIRGYKASVKTFATINQIEFEWQSRFHDHIIHSSKELSNIRQYIVNNPANWEGMKKIQND